MRDGVEHWPWRTGLYAGGGQVVHASPGAGEVVEEALANISFDALFVTR